MDKDIVFPNENEEDFISIAKKLNYNNLVFAYLVDGKVSKEYINSKKEILKNIDSLGIKVEIVFVLIEKNKNKISEVSKIIGNNTIIYKAEDEEALRYVIEKTKISMVYNLEYINPKDHLHYRRSGIDQIIATMIKIKGKEIIFSFSDMLNSINRPLIMGRVMQSISILKKYKCGYNMYSFAKNPYEMRSQKDIKSFVNVLSSRNL